MRKIVVVAPIILMALVVLSAISDGAEKEPYEIHFTPNEKYEGWIEYELEKPLNKKRALEKGNEIMRTAKKDFTTIGIYRKNEKLVEIGLRLEYKAHLGIYKNGKIFGRYHFTSTRKFSSPAHEYYRSLETS